MKKQGHTYFENLDATRFFGFFHVFLAHCFFTSNTEIGQSLAFEFATKNIRSGFLGLDYFFVLSSFLLTWLAMEERTKTGSFHPGLFLVRRGLRLWPLYFLLIFGTYSLVDLFGNQWSIQELPPISVFLLFWSNIWMSLNGQNFLFLLVFFWSIAAEEQFYLLWAVVLKFFHRHLAWVLGSMILASLLFRFMYLDREPFLFFNTISYLGNFALGGWAALQARKNGRIIQYVRRMPRIQIALVYFVLAVLTAGYFRWFMNDVMVIFEKLIFSSFFAFVILEQCFAEHSIFKFGRLKRISYLGQLSLGLYCFHGIVLTFLMPYLRSHGFTEELWQVFLLNPILILALTLLVSILSYELFEKHMHRLRRFVYPKTSAKTSGV